MKKLQVLTVLVACLLVVSCVSISRSLLRLNYTSEQIAEFERVTTQLNTPEKVDWWLKTNFFYDRDILRLCRSRMYTRAQVYDQFMKTPMEVFFKKEGVCFDAANFAAYCLYKAGYKVRAPLVKRYGKGHSVCAVMVDSEWWKVGNTRSFSPTGPYKSYKELLRSVKGGKPEEVYYGYRKGW